MLHSFCKVLATAGYRWGGGRGSNQREELSFWALVWMVGALMD